MKKRYTEEQIIAAMKEHELGEKIEDICQKMGISIGTFYNWRAKYGAEEESEAKRIKQIEQENNKLKQLLAEQLLKIEAMKDEL